MTCIQVIGILFMNFCLCAYLYISLSCGYSKFVYEFMFLMYLVMDHMSRICYDFEHSSSIRSVSGRIINTCYIIEFYIFYLISFILFHLFIHL